jgi:hypothetical protein
LTDAWAQRVLNLIVRDVAALTPTSKALHDYLRVAETRAEEKSLAVPAPKK